MYRTSLLARRSFFFSPPRCSVSEKQLTWFQNFLLSQEVYNNRPGDGNLFVVDNDLDL